PAYGGQRSHKADVPHWKRSVARLVLVWWQGRMFFLAGRIYMPSAIILTVLALWFRTRFDISEHCGIP
ncbi:hypothetical protein, partial [Pseudomonas syringae]|uniref:hypothetical protein n=1 Tax=Pseudomonas syringae TaxID=317 RepID=UPI001E31DC1B